jgi:hypothetical protein
MNNSISDKKTIVLGTSLNSWRYSHKAVLSLRSSGYQVIAIGNKSGFVGDVEIRTLLEQHTDIHTITIYLSAQNQIAYYDYIISLHPERVIFNPGAENAEFEKIAEENGIQVENACTLVLLAIGSF